VAVLTNSIAAQVVLIATAGVLFYAALTDLKTFTISNSLIIALVVLYVMYTTLSGRWADAPGDIGFAALILAFLICVYALGWMGGGDVKLLSVALLWSGIHCALVFAVMLLVFASAHTLIAKLRRTPMPQHIVRDRTRIPFAPSVAASLIGVFMLGCLRPPA
jgi:prepilin peptidase CpaA